MAKKKDLTKAAQDATKMMFGVPAGVPETSGDTTGKQDATLDGERPQDAPEATEKPRRGRPREKPVEASGTAQKPSYNATVRKPTYNAIEDQLEVRRKAIEEGRMITVPVQYQEPDRTKATVYVQDQEPEVKTVTVSVQEKTKTTKTPTKKNRTKNSGDYLRLDMVVDGTDLKKYVGTMARVKGVSMTAYIQDLILKDMKKNDGKSFTITV